MDENEEFMSVAMADFSSLTEKDGEDKSSRVLRGTNGTPPVPAIQETLKSGKHRQYAFNGTGFIPVSETIRALPAGVYKIEVINNMCTFVPQDITTDNLMRLPDSKSDQVITEIEQFWKMKERFRHFGFAYKRGFLLWGPAGSGKTSTIAFVTKQMVASGGIVIIGNFNPIPLASMLHSLRSVESQRPIILLLEDIDTIIEQHGEAEVLSLLDGESSIDNVVAIATTNYPEKLDGRVVNRPSRFDRVVKINVPNTLARRAYLAARGMPADVDLDTWVAQTEGFSIAHLKELVVGVFCYGNSFEDEIKRLKSMFRTPKSGNSDNAAGFGCGKD